MRSPGNYDSLTGYDGGYMDVAIGKWFKATKQILLSVDFEFSSEVISSGRPLYATGKITFEPFRLISNKEYQGYFIN